MIKPHPISAPADSSRGKLVRGLLSLAQESFRRLDEPALGEAVRALAEEFGLETASRRPCLAGRALTLTLGWHALALLYQQGGSALALARAQAREGLSVALTIGRREKPEDLTRLVVNALSSLFQLQLYAPELEPVVTPGRGAEILSELTDPMAPWELRHLYRSWFEFGQLAHYLAFYAHLRSHPREEELFATLVELTGTDYRTVDPSVMGAALTTSTRRREAAFFFEYLAAEALRRERPAEASGYMKLAALAFPLPPWNLLRQRMAERLAASP